MRQIKRIGTRSPVFVENCAKITKLMYLSLLFLFQCVIAFISFSASASADEDHYIESRILYYAETFARNSGGSSPYYEFDSLGILCDKRRLEFSYCTTPEAIDKRRILDIHQIEVLGRRNPFVHRFILYGPEKTCLRPLQVMKWLLPETKPLLGAITHDSMLSEAPATQRLSRHAYAFKRNGVLVYTIMVDSQMRADGDSCVASAVLQTY